MPGFQLFGPHRAGKGQGHRLQAALTRMHGGGHLRNRDRHAGEQEGARGTQIHPFAHAQNAVRRPVAKDELHRGVADDGESVHRFKRRQQMRTGHDGVAQRAVDGHLQQRAHIQRQPVVESGRSGGSDHLVDLAHRQQLVPSLQGCPVTQSDVAQRRRQVDAFLAQHLAQQPHVRGLQHGCVDAQIEGSHGGLCHFMTKLCRFTAWRRGRLAARLPAGGLFR
jgi:hypothetical protein